MTNKISEEKINYVFDNPYFHINKKLQILAGLWPFESRRINYIRRGVMCFFFATVMVFVVNGCRKWCGVNLDFCGENLVGIIYIIAVTSKLFSTAIYEERFKIIYAKLAKNWLEFTDPHEHDILTSFAKIGKLKTVGYLVYQATAGFGFCQIPMISVFLDYVKPLNESRPKMLFVNAEYNFDPFKYFYHLYIFFMLATASAVFIIASIDTTFTVIVHQIMGVIGVMKYRLNRATVTFDQRKDVSYELIVRVIHLHVEVLQFCELIEKSYNIFFLVLMGLTVIFLSTGAVVIMVHVGSVLHSLRLFMVLIGAILHFLFLTWPGQNIIDHTSDLYVAIYATEWYNISERSKQLLKVIMLKCLKPCFFTAGGLYIMNLENFGSIMKTAVSYMAVVSSFQ